MDVTPLSSSADSTRCELVSWPPGEREPAVLVEALLVQGRHALPAVPGRARVLVQAGGGDVAIEHAEGPRTRLRPFESHAYPGAWSADLQVRDGAAELLCVTSSAAIGRVRAEVLPLGTRRSREDLGPGLALLFVSSGSVEARLTGEEEPFQLEVGDGLWLRGLRGGEEVLFHGLEVETTVVLVGLEPRKA